MTPAPSEQRKHLGSIVIALSLALVISLAGLSYVGYKRVYKQHRPISSTFMDGRVLGNSAQQYFLTTGKTIVTFGYNPKTGAITGDLTPWLSAIGKGYSIPDTTFESGSSRAFSITFNGQTVTYSDEGKTTIDPSR